MKRRRAIQSIIIISSGFALLPSCRMEQVPGYEHLPLQRTQLDTIQALTNSILPLDDLPVENPENTTEFLLTILNDCSGPEHIDQYMTGLNEFEQYVRSQFNAAFTQLDESQKKMTLEYLSGSEGPGPELKMFYQTTRRYTIQHFTGSEYFMTNYLNYEMAPGRFVGCVEI